jgi:2-oxoglutarate ferredoxin oxidoreductase subunit beta
MSEREPTILDTENPPGIPAQRVGDTKPKLLLSEDHDLCAGCGEPLALRMMLEAIEELGCSQSSIGVIGIGCYTALTSIIDLDLVQALHGRAPSIATGAKRMQPNQLIFTLQGDGDMVNEGLQEVIHSAARGESITCVMLNNGVFGETGGHMTATTVLGQRTKNTIEGRDAHDHGHPILIAEMLAQLGGAAYVARCGVYNAAEISRTKRVLKKAFQSQIDGRGFSFVEILTMCPTGWFIPTSEGPDYLNDVMAPVHRLGELKADGTLIDTNPNEALPSPAEST